MATKSEIGRKSRQKGKRGEREVAKILQDHGYPGRRSAQVCGKTGQAADVVGLPGVHIEVKRVERLDLDKAYAQACRDAEASGKGEIPVVVHRKSRSPWMVTMALDDFLKIYQEEKND